MMDEDVLWLVGVMLSFLGLGYILWLASRW